MIKTWVFEFVNASGGPGDQVPPQTATAVFEAGIAPCGAAHILAILGRAMDGRRIRTVNLFGKQVIPILRRAEIA